MKSPAKLSRVCAAILVGAACGFLGSAGYAQVSDDVVRIGVLGDMSGPYAGNIGPGFTLAVRMAVEDFGGKVLGKNIEVTAADDQNKPGVGINIAREWIESGKFDTIVSGSASSIALGLQTFMKEKKKPFLTTTLASDLTGKACSPMMVQFSVDTYALAKAGVESLLKQGFKTFYFITVDYAFGKAFQDDATRFIEAGGGKVVGSVKHPLGTTDYSSYLLQAQASGAKAVVVLNAGTDLNNTLKQAAEFRLAKSGQAISIFGMTINSVTAMGLEVAQGLQITTPFYWDRDADSRAFSERFMARVSGGVVPTFLQAAAYSATLHYLKGVQAAGTDEGAAVVARMKALPVSDFSMKNAKIREDGQIMRPVYAVQVKSPAQSRNKNDLYAVKAELAPAEVFRPMAEGGCDFVKAK